MVIVLWDLLPNLYLTVDFWGRVPRVFRFSPQDMVVYATVTSS